MGIKLVIISVVFVAIGCAFADNDSKRIRIQYPYKAEKTKEERILSNSINIKLDMSIEQVEKFMGKPDEIRKIYDKRKRHKKVGLQYIYLLQRDTDKGNVKDINEKSIRILFNNDEILIKAYAVQIPKFKKIDIKKRY